MKALLQTFVDIALWRKGPQDLPASRGLAALVLAVYVATRFVQIRLFHLGLRDALLIVGIDVAMIAAWLWLVLAFFGRRQRFVQTITAVFGTFVLLGAFDIAIRALQLAMGSAQGPSGSWLLLRFFAFALILGRIFMHALDRGLITGMALTVAIIYSTEAVGLLLLDRF